MTVNEIKLDLYQQGFILQEGQPKRLVGTTTHEILLMKWDTDGLRLDARIDVSEDAWKKESTQDYIQQLRVMARNVNEFQMNRHAQNIGDCIHDEVLIGSLRACTKCMAKFGERILQNLNFN